MKRFFSMIMLLSVFTYVQLFAQKNPYSSADKETQKVLKKVDKLIQKGQYQTAFGSLGADTNEYIIAKKIELCSKYFALSMMHTMFAFKNLEKGETLYDVRHEVSTAGEITLTSVLYDPAEVVKGFIEANGEKPILDYALGLYYDDVIYRYSGNWIMSDEEIMNNALTYLRKAYDQDCYDGFSLSTLAFIYFSMNDIENAKMVFDTKEQEGYKFTADDDYNYSIILWDFGDLKKALKYSERCIKGYSDNPEYQCDAYIITTRIALSVPDYKKAESMLKKCEAKYPDDYRIPLYRITLYALQGNKQKTLNSADVFFAISPENPEISQMIIENFEKAGVWSWLPEFFETNLVRYTDNLSAKQNLLIHYAYTLYRLEDYERAAQAVAQAKEELVKDDSLSPEIEKFLDRILETKNQ